MMHAFWSRLGYIYAARLRRSQGHYLYLRWNTIAKVDYDRFSRILGH